MNLTQYTHQGSEENMAAATAGYNEQQMAAGNMAMGMGQHFGSQSNMLGGDSTFYQLDPATFDSQNPPPIDPNQTPLLNNGESELLQNFFDDPNHINPFDYTARPDEKPASNGNSLFGAAVFDHQTGTINPSPTLAQSGHSLQKTHLNAARGNYSGGQQDLMSADDYRAAQTIDNFKTTPASNDFASTQNSSAFSSGGSWGNFMMPLQANLGMDMGFAGAFGGQNNYISNNSQARASHSLSQPQQRSGQNSNIQQQHFYAQPQAAPPPQPPSQNQGTDSASQHVRQQQAQPSPFQANRSTHSELPHGHGRPPLVQWGSDPHFLQGAFAASSPQQSNKDGNLLNIYGAEQAAINGQVQKHGRKSTGRGNSITTPIGTSSGAPWGGMSMGGHSSSHDRDEQPRKRRKSQVDREEGHEWASSQANQPSRIKTEDSDDEDATQGTAGTAKRRKSAYNRQSVDSPEAEDDEGDDAAARKRRGAKKARETLSEAQKRDNHIKSEKKRREIITTGYSDLNNLVPCLAAGKSGLSRSECLQEVASYLRSLVDGTVDVMSRFGITDADWDEWRHSAEGQGALNGFIS